MPSAYYWQGDNRTGHVTNLGDQLTPLLLRHFSNLSVFWSPADLADIVCTGSVLDVLPRSGFHGTVIGAGQLHHSTLTDLTFAKVLAVRGTLTRDRIQCPGQSPVIGDPVLLASELANPTPDTIEIGVIPHWSDHDLWPQEYANALKYGYATPTLIDITADPISTIAAIGSCRKVVTSTLHGAVIADAYGIPRRCEMAPSMQSDRSHEGHTFKFMDYASALGQELRFGELQTAPKVRVDQIQTDLFNAFKTLGEQYV